MYIVCAVLCSWLLQHNTYSILEFFAFCGNSSHRCDFRANSEYINSVCVCVRFSQPTTMKTEKFPFSLCERCAGVRRRMNWKTRSEKKQRIIIRRQWKNHNFCMDNQSQTVEYSLATGRWRRTLLARTHIYYDFSSVYTFSLSSHNHCSIRANITLKKSKAKRIFSTKLIFLFACFLSPSLSLEHRLFCVVFFVLVGFELYMIQLNANQRKYLFFALFSRQRARINDNTTE